MPPSDPSPKRNSTAVSSKSDLMTSKNITFAKRPYKKWSSVFWLSTSVSASKIKHLRSSNKEKSFLTSSGQMSSKNSSKPSETTFTTASFPFLNSSNKNNRRIYCQMTTTLRLSKPKRKRLSRRCSKCFSTVSNRSRESTIWAKRPGDSAATGRSSKRAYWQKINWTFCVLMKVTAAYWWMATCKSPK